MLYKMKKAPSSNINKNQYNLITFKMREKMELIYNKINEIIQKLQKCTIIYSFIIFNIVNHNAKKKMRDPDHESNQFFFKIQNPAPLLNQLNNISKRENTDFANKYKIDCLITLLIDILWLIHALKNYKINEHI